MKTCYLIGYTNTGYKVFDPITEKFDDVCNVAIKEDRVFKDNFPMNKHKQLHTKQLFEFHNEYTPCTCNLETLNVNPKLKISPNENSPS